MENVDIVGDLELRRAVSGVLQELKCDWWVKEAADEESWTRGTGIIFVMSFVMQDREMGQRLDGEREVEGLPHDRNYYKVIC